MPLDTILHLNFHGTTTHHCRVLGLGGRWEHSSKGANGKSGELLCSEFRTLSPSLSWLQYTFPRFLCTPPLSLSQTPQTIHHPCPSMQTCTGSSKSPAPCLCTVFTARPPP